jgi:hypothetical protein
MLAGHTVNAPKPLEQPGEGDVLVCCAYPAGDLVLDM